MNGIHDSIAPDGYTTPTFPSLKWPFPVSSSPARNHLYYIDDIWLYTTTWNVILFFSTHFSAGVYSVVANRRWRRRPGLPWLVPIAYGVVGGIEGFVAGSVVGLLAGGLFYTGRIHMSTWIPLCLALVNSLVLILSSFSMRGGL